MGLVIVYFFRCSCSLQHKIGSSQLLSESLGLYAYKAQLFYTESEIYL